MARTEQFEPLAERLIVAVSKLGREAQRIGLALIRKLAERRPVADHAVAVASAPRSPPFATRLSVGLVCSAMMTAWSSASWA